MRVSWEKIFGWSLFLGGCGIVLAVPIAMEMHILLGMAAPAVSSLFLSLVVVLCGRKALVDGELEQLAILIWSPCVFGIISCIFLGCAGLA